MIYSSSVVMNSDMYMARKVIKKCIDHLRVHMPSLLEDDLFDIRLILNELIINAIVHGNQQDVDKIIRIHMTIIHETEEIVIVIKDEGKGLPFEDIRDLDDFHEELSKANKGKGLMLVSALVDTMEILSKEAGIKVSKYLEISKEVEGESYEDKQN